MAAENLPEEVSLDQLKGDCQERWEQAGGSQPQQDQARPSVEQPTPEQPERQGHDR